MPSETFERLQSALLDEAAALRMPPHNLAEVEAQTIVSANISTK